MERNYKKCVVCGAEFYAPPSSKKITCGKACSRVRKLKTHAGQRCKDETRAAISAAHKGNRPPTYNAFFEANKASEKTQRTEMNSAAKLWRIRNIDSGEEYEFVNLSNFIRTHSDLFDIDPEDDSEVHRIAAGFHTIKRNYKLGKSCITYKRWQITYFDDRANWQAGYEMRSETAINGNKTRKQRKKKAWHPVTVYADSELIEAVLTRRRSLKMTWDHYIIFLLCADEQDAYSARQEPEITKKTLSEEYIATISDTNHKKRLKMVLLHLRGAPYRQIAAELGVSAPLVEFYCRKFRKGGFDALIPAHHRGGDKKIIGVTTTKKTYTTLRAQAERRQMTIPTYIKFLFKQDIKNITEV